MESDTQQKTGIKDMLIGMIVLPQIIYGMVKSYYTEDEDENAVLPPAKTARLDICRGILCWACVGGLLTCAGIRGCQEVKKHFNKTPQTPNVFAPSNCR